MKITVYGIARLPGSDRWIEIKDVRAGPDLLSRETTGVFYTDRTEGVKATHEKNVEEAFRLVATVRAGRLTGDS